MGSLPGPPVCVYPRCVSVSVIWSGTIMYQRGDATGRPPPPIDHIMKQQRSQRARLSPSLTSKLKTRRNHSGWAKSIDMKWKHAAASFKKSAREKQQAASDSAQAWLKKKKHCSLARKWFLIVLGLLFLSLFFLWRNNDIFDCMPRSPRRNVSWKIIQRNVWHTSTARAGQVTTPPAASHPSHVRVSVRPSCVLSASNLLFHYGNTLSMRRLGRLTSRHTGPATLRISRLRPGETIWRWMLMESRPGKRRRRSWWWWLWGGE